MEILFALGTIILIVFFAIVVFRLHTELKAAQNKLSIQEEQVSKAHTVVKELTGVIERNKVRLDTEITRADSAEIQFRQLEESMSTQLEAWRISAEKDIRKDAMDRSRRVLRGQATEHLAPYLMNGFNPKDFRFLGDPIDYLIVVGGSDIRDGVKDKVENIVLLDIKTGKAKLSKVQRRIRDAITDGRISFMTFNPDSGEVHEYKFTKNIGDEQ